jgi:hypothetical protein
MRRILVERARHRASQRWGRLATTGVR